MRIILVGNRRSGTFAGAEDGKPGLAEQLRARGLEVLEDASDDPLPEKMQRAAARDDVEALVVAGGDGTIACAAQALLSRPKSLKPLTLGVVPMGTMNLLAKDVGIPVDVEQAVAAISGGQHRPIDVGEVNGHAFLINSVIGMPARMTKRREAKRGRFSWGDRWALFLAGLRALTRYPGVTISMRHDGERIRVRTRALVVVNNDYEEGLGAIFKRSSVDSGKLSLYVAHGLTPLRALKLALAMSFGVWRSAEGLQRLEAEEFVIHSRRGRVRVMSDGEAYLVEPPLRYRMHAGALQIFVPAAAAAVAEVEPATERVAA